MQELNKLIDELLSRDLRPSTREDLAAWRKEIAAGTLAPDDERYIRALYERVVGGGVPKSKKRGGADEARPEVGEVAQLRAEIAQLTSERDQLQATVATLRQEIEALKAAKG